MPASRKPAKASRRKVWMHMFYLSQPFLQFFALLAVMFIFIRCSPLAPSSLKESALKNGPTLEENGSAEAEGAALEEEIQKGLHELATSELAVISHTDMEKIGENIASLDDPLDEQEVKTIFAKRDQNGVPADRRKKFRLFYLSLDLSEQAAFFENGSLRIDLTERLKARTKDAGRQALLRRLRKSLEKQDLSASSVLVLPDKSLRAAKGAFADLELKIQVSLAVLDEERAYLEIRQLENHDADNAALLDAALKDARHLAILLE